MKLKQLFLLLFTLSAPAIVSAQNAASPWSLHLGAGWASENNLGDNGMRTFAAITTAVRF